MSDCTEWMGAKRRGYGQARWRGEMIAVHRKAWIEQNGAIPQGLLVLHHCDNRACYNVDHLFLGTHQDNSSDMVAKGRSRLCGIAGERHYKARLTDEQVVSVKADLRSSYQLAADLGVSPSTIRMIRSGKNRKEVMRHE